MTVAEEFLDILHGNDRDTTARYLLQLDEPGRKEAKKVLIEILDMPPVITHYPGGSYSVKSAFSDYYRAVHTACYLLLGYSEFRKYSSLDAKLIGEVMDYYIPDWLDRAIKKQGLDSVYFMNYDTAMTLIERGALKSYTDSELAILLQGEIRNTEMLTKREVTLKEHFWHLFDFDGNQAYFDTHCATEKSAFDTCKAYEVIISLTERGLLPRERVMKEALKATVKGFKKDLTGWFAGMYAAMKPTEDEILRDSDSLLSLLTVPHSRAVTTALDLLSTIAEDDRWNAADFVLQAGMLTSSTVKTIATKTLKLIDRIAARNDVSAADIAAAVVEAFVNYDERIQTSAAKILLKRCAGEKETVAGLLEPYSTSILSPVRELLSEFSITTAYPEPLPENDTPAETKMITDDNRLPSVETEDDFIFLASKVITDGSPAEISQFLDAMMHYTLAPRHSGCLSRLTPMLTAALGAVGQWVDNITAYALGVFVVEWVRSLKRPEAAALKDIYDKAVSDDKALPPNQRRGYDRESLDNDASFATFSYNNYGARNACGQMWALRSMLKTVSARLRKGRDLPLLSTPTHAPYFIDPAALVERAEIYMADGVEPDDMDMQIALSRTVFAEASAETVQRVAMWKDCEWKRLLLFMLGDRDAMPQGPFDHQSWWMTASLVKSPLKIYDAFARFDYSASCRDWLNGNFRWDVSDDGSFRRLRLDMPPSPGLEIINRDSAYPAFSYSSQGRRRKFLSSEPRPLLAETLFPSIQWAESPEERDLRLMFSLTPCAPESLIASCLRRGVAVAVPVEVYEKTVNLTAISELHVMNHEWHETSYLLLAASMLVADKTVRGYAAEVWMQRVAGERMDSTRLGHIVGRLEAARWAPLKRLTDLVSQLLPGLGLRHSKALGQLLGAMIAELPAESATGLKKLLEVYREVLERNGEAPDSEAAAALGRLASVNSLKSIATNILGRRNVREE